MLIRCPKCNTTYKVSAEALRDTTAVFRCSRCKNVFELEPEGRIEGEGAMFPARTQPTEAQHEPELNFTFPAKELELNGPQGDEPSGGSAQTVNTTLQDPGEGWSINAGAKKQEEPFTISPSPEIYADEKIVDAPADSAKRDPQNEAVADPRDAIGNVFPLDTFRDQPASTAPYLGLLVLLVIFFSFAAAYQKVHPAASDELMGKIPLVGSSVLHNDHLKNGVLLKSMRAGYQTIQGNREVFVVSGEAVNQNPVVIRRVQILGHIYNQEGKEVEQQAVWVGNAISAKFVRGMSAQDVIDLQRLPPLKSFDIPPGDSVPFTIVFFKPAKGVKDFSCEIQSAEGAA